MPAKRIYWDTSCFISVLSATHSQEKERARICMDILKHAQNDAVQIWTSVFTIVETLRPKEEYKPSPLPLWSEALTVRNTADQLIYPHAMGQLQQIWDYWKRHTVPTRKLTSGQEETIQKMFAWPFIRTIQVVPTIAERAADIARSYNMKTADSLHVASALARQCEELQRWDRDYKKTDQLIPSIDPTRMSPQDELSLDPAESDGFSLS